MAQEKRALYCVFQPDRLESTEEMRRRFAGSYQRFLDMPGVESKCWWVDQEKGQWGAFYVWRSAQELDDYLASDIWLKVVPEKYGCLPTWRVLEAGLLLSKALVTDPDSSWRS